MKSFERYICHPVFGEGKIIDTRLQSQQLKVQFRDGFVLWLSSDGLKISERTEESINEIAARRMIEAFRMGVVPHQDVAGFTFGRDDEIKVIEKSLAHLQNGVGGGYLIEGEYGSGKSHLLEYVRHLAIKQGLATAYCELDPQEVSPHRPKQVYRELIHNLRYINSGAQYSFRDIMRKAVSLDLPDHKFFTPLLKKLNRLDQSDTRSEVFWQWIEGESTKEYAAQHKGPYRIPGAQGIPALYDFSTASDFYCYILSGLSYILKNLGMNGLVLLIDEAESVTHLWNPVAYDRGLNFLEGLIRTAFNDETLKKVDEHMIHNKVRTTPYIYRDSYILLYVATTPTAGEYSYAKLVNLVKKRLVLGQPSEAHLVELYQNLCFIYFRAYNNFTLSDDWKKKLLNTALRKKAEGLRFFIKYWVEGLDYLRWNMNK